MAQRKTSQQKFWFIPEEFPVAHMLVVRPVAEGWVQQYQRYGAGSNLRHFFLDSKNFNGEFGFRRDEFDRSSAYIVEKMISQPAWAERINQLCLTYSRQLAAQARQNLRLNLSQASTAAIIRRFRSTLAVQQPQHITGTITSWTADADQERFSNYIKGLLQAAAQRQGQPVELAAAFSTLTTPTKASLAEQEEVSLLQLAQRLGHKPTVRRLVAAAKDLEQVDGQLRKIDPALWRLVNRFHQQYCWLVFVYMGPANPKSYYYGVWQSMLRQGADAVGMAKGIAAKRQHLLAEQAVLYRQLRLRPAERRMIRLAQGVVWLKAYRKDMLSLCFYSYERLLAELGRRFSLSVKQLWMCLPEEVNEQFLSRQDAGHILNERVRHTLLIYERGRWRLLVGRQAVAKRQQMVFETVVVDEVDELVGTCAYPGKVTGTVKIIHRPDEMAKMQRGDILVSHSTTPNLVPAMKQAGAIVTNAGGLTCHAAIVSRELKIPCVVGIKIATKVLADGDRVEVDAAAGIVRKMVKEKN